MPYIPYLPYIANIPYFPNMPYQTDHTHHTYPTYHTTPPPHHRGREGEDLISGQYMGPIPWGVAGPGAYICIYIYIYICVYKYQIWAQSKPTSIRQSNMVCRTIHHLVRWFSQQETSISCGDFPVVSHDFGWPRCCNGPNTFVKPRGLQLCGRVRGLSRLRVVPQVGWASRGLPQVVIWLPKSLGVHHQKWGCWHKKLVDVAKSAKLVDIRKIKPLASCWWIHRSNCSWMGSNINQQTKLTLLGTLEKSSEMNEKSLCPGPWFWWFWWCLGVPFKILTETPKWASKMINPTNIFWLVDHNDQPKKKQNQVISSANFVKILWLQNATQITSLHGAQMSSPPPSERHPRRLSAAQSRAANFWL